MREQDDVTDYLLLVPASADKAAGISKGSGIVGRFRENRLVVDYEGNLYGAENLTSFPDKVRHAFFRARDRYPTVARRTVDPSSFVVVGRVADDGWPEPDPVSPADRVAFEAWTGESAETSFQYVSAKRQEADMIAAFKAGRFNGRV